MLRTIRWLLVIAAVMTAAVSPGCGEPRAAINQVQPGAIEKSVFDGEWFYQQTVIDTPYGAGFSFVGEQGRMERIRWEIQEDFLLARRSYEWIAGSEPVGIAGDQVEQNAVVAAYRIDSHFDIRRSYNPLTGEELNVIVENSSDRPWYERQFIRVDWSENLANATDVFAITRILDGIQASSVAYTPENPNDPNAPRFERNESNEVNYIDITNRMFVEPQSVFIEGFGSIPSCYLTSNAHLDCAAAEVGLRNSFLRVDSVETDYQPNSYTGDRMERFGYFITERSGYDTHYGVVEGQRYRFNNRHNLWQASHRRNADGTFVGCHADADCDDGSGSRCDLAYAMANRTVDASGLLGICTIPYRQRETRPIVYYMANMPEDLVPDVQDFASEWAGAFGDVVDSLRENECLSAGGDAGTCAAERDRADSDNLYIACHSPVVDADPDVCGEVGLEVRPGDLRYSVIGWVNEPHLSSPLGYGPSSADPITGEIVMANAFVYGAGVETLESYARDILRLLAGDVTEDQVADGATVQAWLDQVNGASARAQASGRPADSHVIHVDGFNLDEVAAGMDFSYVPRTNIERPTNLGEAVRAVQSARDRLWQSGTFGNGTSAYQRTLRNLVGTDIEAQMVELAPELLAETGLDPQLARGGAITSDIVAQQSILQGRNPDRGNVMQVFRDQMNADNCVLDAGFADEGLLGLMRAIQTAAANEGSISFYGVTYPLLNEAGELDWELVRAAIRHPIFHAVTAHEVGHTLGLRHNFSGSFDALNYLPEYWTIRNDGSMRPRQWDTITESELDQRILEYQYSTVMDYGVNFVVTDAFGISHYDHAALKMGYGDLVEVFTNVVNDDDAVAYNVIQQLGWPIPLKMSSFTGGSPSAFVYTDWPTIAGGVDNLQARADVPYTSLQPDAELASQGLDDYLLRDAQERPVVPYLFCSDEQADLNPDCLRYDQGADVAETMHSIADSYWNYYIFASFRRQRIGFGTEAVFNRTYSRFFEKLQRANQIYALYRPIFTDLFGVSDTDAFWTAEDGMGAWTGAVGTAFELLARVLTAPEPDSYTLQTRPDGTQAFLSSTSLAAQSVNAFDGRYLATTWDFDAGYYWFDQLSRVGYFYDKLAALMILTDPTTYFLGRDSDEDIRQYQINFANSFGPALTSLMRGIMGEDWTSIAPRISSGNVTYPTPAQLADGSMPGVPLDPNTGFSIQLFASVLSMGYISQTYDQDFLNRSRIWIDGANEAINVDPSRIVSYTDADAGVTYNAVSYMDGGRETGVGARLLNHALALEAEGSSAELRAFRDNIDLVRRLSSIFGDGVSPLSP